MREELSGAHRQARRLVSTERMWLGSLARLWPRTRGEVCRVTPGERSNLVARTAYSLRKVALHGTKEAPVELGGSRIEVLGTVGAAG